MVDKAESDISIHVDEAVWTKVMHWIDKSPVEVSGLGKVVFDEKTGIFRVIDAFLVQQENSGGDTEMKDTAVAKLMYETHKQPGRLCWWWHSHVNMNAFWSNTDTDTIKKLGGGGWVVATVLNKKREYRSAYMQAAPNRMFIDNLPTYIGARQIAEDLIRAWDNEYDSNVTEKKSYFAGNYQEWLKRQADNGLHAPKKTETQVSIPSIGDGRKYGVDFKDEGADDEEIKASLRRFYLNLERDVSKSEGVEVQADGDGGEADVSFGLGIDDETGAISGISSDDAPEQTEELGYETLPYEEASSPDEVSVDPRQGDAEELDALDLMNQNIERYNNYHHKFRK